MAFPVTETVDGVLKGKILDPVFLAVFLVAELIHHIEGIAALGIYRFIETHGTLDGVQGIDDVFFFDADFFGNLFDGRLFLMGTDISFPHAERFVGGIAQGAADTDGVVIPQVTADLADDHRDCVSGKFDI